MKLKCIALGLLSLGLVSTAHADGLELGGNVTTFFGWQHDDSNALGTLSGGLPERGATAPSRDTFNFYLDEVELNLAADLGDKIRIRADLDFGGAVLGSNLSDGGGAFVLEQGYVGFGVGEGEIIVGRFNAPIGVYSVDRIDNVTINYPYTFGLLPANVTGAKLYYPFGDMVDLQLYVINNIGDTVSTVAGGGVGGVYPTGGFRLGVNWGEEDRQSTLGLSGIVGGNVAGSNRPLTFIGDLDLTWFINDRFLLQLEGVYRQDNTTVAGAKNNKSISGMLLVDYDITDEWDIYARYDYLHDIQGFYTGVDHQVHAGTIGVGFDIAEGAKFKLEYRLDYQLPAGAISNSISHTVAGQFAYAF